MYASLHKRATAPSASMAASMSTLLIGGSSSLSSTSKASASAAWQTKEVAIDSALVAGAEEAGMSVQFSCTSKAVELKSMDDDDSIKPPFAPASLALPHLMGQEINVLASIAGSRRLADLRESGCQGSSDLGLQQQDLTADSAPACDMKEVVMEPRGDLSGPSSPPRTPGPVGGAALGQDEGSAKMELVGGASSPLSPPMPTVTEEPSPVFITSEGCRMDIPAEQQTEEEHRAASERAMRELEQLLLACAPAFIDGGAAAMAENVGDEDGSGIAIAALS